MSEIQSPLLEQIVALKEALQQESNHLNIMGRGLFPHELARLKAIGEVLPLLDDVAATYGPQKH